MISTIRHSNADVDFQLNDAGGFFLNRNLKLCERKNIIEFWAPIEQGQWCMRHLYYFTRFHAKHNKMKD